MQARSEGAGVEASGAVAVIRWLLVVVLAVAAGLHIYMASWEFGVDGQSVSYYAVNVAIGLAQAVPYAAAVVLALTGRGGRVVWSVLLACGVALCAVYVFYLATSGFGELMLAPLCLVALSLLQLRSRPRPKVAEAQ